MGDDVNTLPTAPTTPDRRARLLAAKLAAVVAPHTGGAAIRPGTFPPGAALQVAARAWVLLDDTIDDGSGLGPAMAWALRGGSAELNVVADAPLEVVARRAGEFTVPIQVWTLAGRELQRVHPGATVAPPPVPAAHLALAAGIEAAGAAVVVEHGVVTGEVRGLEVCRVVDIDDGPGVRLEVGVGRHDREAFAIIHGDVPTGEALAGVVAAVTAARSPQASGHPLSRLAPERLLRWRLVQEPWLVTMESVRPAEPPVPRRSLSDRAPCVAVGRRVDGTAAVIVCSVGVDLDVVPYAADARLAAGVGAGVVGTTPETLIVVPERDLLPVTSELAELLREPLSLVSLERS